MNPLDKYMDMWNHHPRNHVIKGVVFMFAGVIGIGAVILLFYLPQVPKRKSTGMLPPNLISPTPEADISLSTQFVTYNDTTLKAQFSYPSTWVTKTEGDRKDWRVIVSDQQSPYFAVQFRRIENSTHTLDEYIRRQFLRFPEIQMSTYHVSGISYRKVTGDPGLTMYYLYTTEDNAIYEIAVMSAEKDKNNTFVSRNLKLAEKTIQSLVFQSTYDTTKIKVDFQQLRAALEMYLADNGSYPENLEMLVPTYIPVLPHHPYPYYRYVYESYNVITPTYTIKTFLPDRTEYEVANP